MAGLQKTPFRIASQTQISESGCTKPIILQALIRMQEKYPFNTESYVHSSILVLYHISIWEKESSADNFVCQM